MPATNATAAPSTLSVDSIFRDGLKAEFRALNLAARTPLARCPALDEARAKISARYQEMLAGCARVVTVPTGRKKRRRRAPVFQFA